MSTHSYFTLINVGDSLNKRLKGLNGPFSRLFAYFQDKSYNLTMKNIGLFFGGKSVEHDVSIVSAQIISKGFQKLPQFKLIPIYITNQGEWVVFDKFPKIQELKKKKNSASNVRLILNPRLEKLTLKKKSLLGKKIEINSALILIHGTNGEDGTLQGFMETANIPYSGPAVLGSALGMDKVITKDVCQSNHIPIVNYFWFYREKWEENKNKIKEDIKSRLSFPLFVKPANLGSSIGISKATDDQSLEEAIEVAIRYSRKILVEEGVEDAQEINCAVLGFKKPIASLLEEPVHYSKFLTFEEKYIGDATKGGGTMKGAKSKVKIPAPVSNDLKEKISQLAIKTFKILECSGPTRVDFLVSPSGEVFVNEINTIPGSLQQHLWKASDLPLPELIEKTIATSEEVFIEKKKNLTTFESTLLK